MSKDISTSRLFAKQVRTLITPRVVKRAYNNVYKPDGFSLIGDYEKQDVFIVGFPKSGHTWMQYIVVQLLYGLIPEITPPEVAGALVPDIYLKRYYRRLPPAMFFKSHELPRPEYKRVIYLLRDGRDAMVSYYHFQSSLDGHPVDFLKMVQDGEGIFRAKWGDHINAWRENPHQAEILVVQFQDLKYHTVAELKRICKFIGIEREDAYLENVAEATSFKHLRKSDETFWHKDPNGNHFFRRGEVGSYKDEMPADVLEAFIKEAGPLLERYGFMTYSGEYLPLDAL